MSTESSSSLAAVILAAGTSLRMGRPKLLLPWGESTIVGHLITQWRKLGASQITIVCREGDADLDSELDRLGFPAANRIYNPKAEQGMFSSIQCAVRWGGWRANLNHWAFVLGDQPHLRFSSLVQLLSFHKSHPDSVCQPEYDGHACHPVILPHKAFLRLGGSSAGSLKDFIQAESALIRKCSINDPGLRFDLDTPEDYRRARQISLQDADRSAPFLRAGG